VIRETLVNGEEEYTKTDGSQRAIKMTDLVRDALLDQREITGEHKYVFVNRNGEPLDRRNVTQRVWYPLLRNLGLDKRNPYQTRHTAATLLLASGEAAEWIAR
jgi:integrase